MDFLSRWDLGLPGLTVVVLVGGAYVGAWVWVRRGPRRPQAGWGNLIAYLAGVGTLAYAICGPLQVFRTTSFWVASLQVGVLAYITPVGLALGSPIRLAGAAWGRPEGWTPKALSGPVARFLMFPAVSSVLAVGSVLVVFVTPYLEASIGSGPVEALLVAHLVGTGMLFVLPLLVSELLPAWVGPGLCALFAFVDGLLDAVPGIVVMTSTAALASGIPAFHGAADRLGDMGFDQRLAGGVLLAVSEAVGLPVLCIFVVQWMRSEDRAAEAADRAVDAAVLASDGADPLTGGLWWQNDPRFTNRFRPREAAEPESDGRSLPS